MILTFNREDVDGVKNGQAVWLHRIRAEVQICGSHGFSNMDGLGPEDIPLIYGSSHQSHDLIGTWYTSW